MKQYRQLRELIVIYLEDRGFDYAYLKQEIELALENNYINQYEYKKLLNLLHTNKDLTKGNI